MGQLRISLRVAAFALTVLPLCALQDSTDQVLLGRAIAAWGGKMPSLDIRREDLGPCIPVRPGASAKEMEAREHMSADVHPEHADHWLTFDDGTEGPHVSGKTTWVILINSSCGWTRQPLAETILHEVGHALGLGHVSGRKDVMFAAPQRGSSISPEDRARLQELRAASPVE